jgi:allophanate hydrolase subunit 2
MTRRSDPLRVLPGPQIDVLGRRVLDGFLQTRFTVSPQSNRMAYRLTSPMPLAGAPQGEMITEPAFMGAVQITPAGDAILLMADRQTSGGYPQVAVVISADLPCAGQLAPGDAVSFALTTTDAAAAALVEQEGWVRAIR